MHEIFVSYSRDDRSRVDEIASALASRRIPLWIDRRDLPVSMEWLKQVKVAIEGADLLVSFRSDRWETSSACAEERRQARDLHKAMLEVDLRTEDNLAIVRKIEAAYWALAPEQRTHTEVVALAGIWQRQGRPQRLLLDGQLIRRALRLRRTGPPLTGDALTFVAESERRRSRRWWAAGVGGLLALVATCVGCSGFVVVSLIPAGIRAASDQAAGFAAVELDPLANPYDILATVRAGLTAENATYIRRVQMMRALRIPVPDDSYTVAGRLTRIVDASDDRSVIVATDDGRFVLGPDATEIDHINVDLLMPAVSPAGDFVANTLAGEGLVRITRSDGELYRVLTVPGRAGPVAFSPNGRDLAVGTGEDVAIFDVATGVHLVTLRGSVGTVRDIAWTGTTSVTVIAGENRVSTWRWRHGVRLVDDPGRSFVDVAGPDTDGTLAAAEGNGRVSIVQPAPGAVVVSFETSARDVVAVDVHHGLIVLAGSSTLTIHDRRENTERAFAVPGCEIWDVSFSHSGERIYVACGAAGIRAWRTSDGAELSRVEHPELTFTSLAVAADGAVFAGDGSGLLHHYGPDLDVVAQPLVWPTCRLPISRIAVSASGDSVIEAGMAATHMGCTYEALRRGGKWELQNHSLEPGAGDQTVSVSITTTGDKGAVGFSDGRVFVWDPVVVEAHASYHEHGGTVRGVAFSVDGEHLVTASADGIVTVLPSCNFCESALDLATRIDTILARAESLGLR